jgi:hypothetical protein
MNSIYATNVHDLQEYRMKTDLFFLFTFRKQCRLNKLLKLSDKCELCIC